MTRFAKSLPVATIVLAFVVLAAACAAGTREALAQLVGFGAPRPAAAGGILGWIFAEQAMFYRTLAGHIRLARTDGSALWALMGISFVYGIFHAAGPGHGKAVISSYLLANQETWRRGITLSFASAVMQSLTAIAIVGVGAILLGATAKFMGDTVHVIEIVSYWLIVLIGVRLLWVKGRGFANALQTFRAGAVGAAPAHHHGAGCDHHHTAALGAPESVVGDNVGHVRHHDGHHHEHHDELNVLPWGHAHGPEPADLAGPGGWRRGWTTIVAVGLRPCSGAIIVLVFALAQGLLWAGVASTFVMGLGTAITVAAVASVAVGARTVATRIVAKPTGYGGLVLRGLEAGAAALVLTFGVLLLTGYMASERLGLF